MSFFLSCFFVSVFAFSFLWSQDCLSSFLILTAKNERAPTHPAKKKHQFGKSSHTSSSHPTEQNNVPLLPEIPYTIHNSGPPTASRLEPSIWSPTKSLEMALANSTAARLSKPRCEVVWRFKNRLLLEFGWHQIRLQHDLFGAWCHNNFYFTPQSINSEWVHSLWAVTTCQMIVITGTECYPKGPKHPNKKPGNGWMGDYSPCLRMVNGKLATLFRAKTSLKIWKQTSPQ